MKCKTCGKRFDEVVYLGEFGRSFLGKQDKGEYCEACFDEKYPQLKELQREESNE